MIMSTKPSSDESESRVRETRIRVDRLGREEKLALEDQVTQAGAKYEESTWRKTASETIDEIRREVDRMRGARPTSTTSKAVRRGPPVPPGVRSRVTAAIGPITDAEVVYQTNRKTVLRVTKVEQPEAGRVLVLVDDDGVRQIDQIEEAVDSLRGPRLTGPKSELPVEEVEGIGDTYAERLEAEGIHTLGDMEAAGPRRVTEITDAPRATVDKWFAATELMRVKDVGKQFAELMVRAGVTSIAELAEQDPDDLLARLQEYQESVDVTIQGAHLGRDRVQGWVRNARKMTAGSED